MKVLCIGGTGLISSARTHLELVQEIARFLLNRSNHADVPAGPASFVANARDKEAATRALPQRFADQAV
jgi:hypothetical protein